MNYTKNRRVVIRNSLSIAMLVLVTGISVSAEDKVYYNCAMYELVDESFDWNQANEECRLRGGYLVIINDQEEEQFIESLIQNGEKRPIGLVFLIAMAVGIGLTELHLHIQTGK